MILVVYVDPATHLVVALTPPAGLTPEETQQRLVPEGTASFLIDSATLPLDKDIRAWSLDGQGNVTVDQVRLATLANVSAVTNAQLKRWLDGAGKLAAAQAAVATAGGLTLELWYGSAVFHVDDPLLVAMGAAIGMSTADIQAAFNAAAKL
jgi:hypothetical protein